MQEAHNVRRTQEKCLQETWVQDPRWSGITRPYSAKDVMRLRGTIHIEHTLARVGAERFWDLLHEEPYIAALGALTGNQAVQQVLAGLKAIYLSGWQVAGDANLAGQMYPDQSLYPCNSVPNVVKEINNAFLRADQMHHAEGKNGMYWFAPIVADAEAGFGGSLNAFELMKSMIEAGAAAVHFEDQLASAKKCGHMGGKVLVPAQEFVQKLVAARLAADILCVPTILIARTDANGAKLLTSDSDLRDVEFLTGERTPEGYLSFKGGIDAAIARGLIYAPYADMVWCETSEPNLEEARRFAEAIHERFPGKLLAYNCSPSFHRKKSSGARNVATQQYATNASSARDISMKWHKPSPTVNPLRWRWRVPRRMSNSLSVQFHPCKPKSGLPGTPVRPCKPKPGLLGPPVSMQLSLLLSC